MRIKAALLFNKAALLFSKATLLNAKATLVQNHSRHLFKVLLL